MNSDITEFENFLKKSKKSTHTQAVYLQNIRNFLEFVQEKPIKSITHDDLCMYLEKRKKEGIKSKTYNLIITSLRSYYEYCKTQGVVVDPTDSLKSLALPPRTISIAEITKQIDRFLDLIKKSKSIPIRDKAIVMCMAYLNLSTTEILSSCIDDIIVEKKKLKFTFFGIEEKEKISLELNQTWATRDLFTIVHHYLKIRLGIKGATAALFITENNTRIHRFYFNKIFNKMKTYAHSPDIHSRDLRFSSYNVFKNNDKKARVHKEYHGEILDNRFKIKKQKNTDLFGETYQAYDLVDKKNVVIKKYHLDKIRGITRELIESLDAQKTLVQNKKVLFPTRIHFLDLSSAYCVYDIKSSSSIRILDEFINSLFSRPNEKLINKAWYIPTKDKQDIVLPTKEIRNAYEILCNRREGEGYVSEIGIIEGDYRDEINQLLNHLTGTPPIRIQTCVGDTLEFPLYIELLKKFSLPSENELSNDMHASPDALKERFRAFSRDLIEKIKSSILVIQSSQLSLDDQRFFNEFFFVMRSIMNKELFIIWVTSSEETIHFLTKNNAFFLGSIKNIHKNTKAFEKKDSELFNLLWCYRRPCPVFVVLKIFGGGRVIDRIFFYVHEGVLFFKEENNQMCIAIHDMQCFNSLQGMEKNIVRKMHASILQIIKNETIANHKLKILFHTIHAHRKRTAFEYFKEIIPYLKMVGLTDYIITYIEFLKNLASSKDDRALFDEIKIYCYTCQGLYEKAIHICHVLLERKKEEKDHIDIFIMMSRIYRLGGDMEQAALYLEKAGDGAFGLSDTEKAKEIAKDLQVLMKLRKTQFDLVHDTSFSGDYKTILQYYDSKKNIEAYEAIIALLEKEEGRLKKLSLQEQYKKILDKRIINLLTIKNKLIRVGNIVETQKSIFDRAYSLMYSSLFIECIKNTSENNVLFTLIGEEIIDRLSIKSVTIITHDYGRLEILFGSFSREAIENTQMILYTREHCIYKNKCLTIKTQLFKKECALFFPSVELDVCLLLLRFVDLLSSL